MSSLSTFSENEWRIIRLAQDGLAPIEIQSETKRSRSSVSNILSRARRVGALNEMTSTGSGVHVSGRLYQAVRVEAVERGMLPRDLMRAILKNVVEDDLFATVLDK